jgi:hypothetical protein
VRRDTICRQFYYAGQAKNWTLAGACVPEDRDAERGQLSGSGFPALGPLIGKSNNPFTKRGDRMNPPAAAALGCVPPLDPHARPPGRHRNLAALTRISGLNGLRGIVNNKLIVVSTYSC